MPIGSCGGGGARVSRRHFARINRPVAQAGKPVAAPPRHYLVAETRMHAKTGRQLRMKQRMKLFAIGVF